MLVSREVFLTPSHYSFTIQKTIQTSYTINIFGFASSLSILNNNLSS
jgi:hypothetical protein